MSDYGLVAQRLALEEAKTTAGTTRATIYLYLRRNPKASRREIANATGLFLSSVCARVRELLNNGSVVECGMKLCEVTGKQVSTLSPSIVTKAQETV